jgi:DNA-binding PadR family transcriptional regulator/cytochrome c553
MKKKLIWMLMLSVMVVLLAACAGAQGPEGPSGESATAFRKYVGDQACAGCHQDLFDTYMKSGHPWKLSKVVDGQPPAYPFTKLNELPVGYTWDDILYVIGGYAWKARFVNKEGYIITDEPGKTRNAEYLNQWNFANEIVGKDAGWVKYNSGKEKLPYDCGTCHTTGYSPQGNQDDLPGLVGTWNQEGIRCEECHGNGSLHILFHAHLEPVYGLDMIRELARHGYTLSPGTLYPILHQLARDGFLQVESRLVDGKLRKYYRLTAAGREALSEALVKARELLGEIDVDLDL